MTIAYAALHRTLRYRDEDTKLFVAAFADGTHVFRPPSATPVPIDGRDRSRHGRFCPAPTSTSNT